MPRIRAGDENLDLCQNCWSDLSETDFINLAKLAYIDIDIIKAWAVEEGDGGAHPTYENLDLVCCLCDEPLTNGDDIGEPVSIDLEDEE